MIETTNLFLLHLPDKIQREIMSCVEYVHLDRGEMIYNVGESVKFVDFPESGVASIVRIDDAEEIEIATVGCEGFVGIGLLLDVPYQEQKTFCQVEGRSLRITEEKFSKIRQNNVELKQACNRFLAVYLDQVSSAVVCNFHHTVEQRCAKWLLFTRDRAAHQNKFNLTQDYLAVMLGLSRTGVNASCSKFANAGLISYSRGSITILDASGLEKFACLCYARTNAYRKLALGY